MRYAKEDWDASVFLQAASAGIPRHVCWFSQQAAEKALKAALVYEEEDFSYTHDLDALRGLLPSSWILNDIPPDLADLRAWSMEARYPGEWKEPSESDAAQAMEMARQVYDSIEAEFQRRAGTP